MTTKLENTFEYQAEASKKSFQGHLGSMLELEKLIADKVAQSKTSHICFSKEEAKVITDWITNTVLELSADYTILNRTNLLLNKNNQILQGLIERRTPNLKSLLSA